MTAYLDIATKALDAREADEQIADWLTYGAIDALELQSGDYEQWARAQLLNRPARDEAAG